MRKLSNKNKIYIIIFSLIVISMVVILIYAVKLSRNDLTNVYDISTNSVIYDEENNLIDTSVGGNISKSWDDVYYYVTDESKYDIGKVSVVYEKATEEVFIFGKNHQILLTGDILENSNKTTISDLKSPGFYKLGDRKYLIVSSEIYNEDKSIYTSNYLVVSIDKQGNASLLNDVINVKTINPMILTFDKYFFDVANEKIIVGNKEINLKLINGSTNEYIPNKNKPIVEEVDMTEFIDAYNKLVSDFEQYAANNKNVGSSNQVITNNTIVNTGSNNNYNSASQNNNKTNINKRVSLRGALSYPTYIDVTYVVTDPEDRYQAIYLLITGMINGEMKSEKIILDKYETKYRITDLSPKNEYTISLGYVEVVEEGKEKTLVDNIEDVINVRTTKSNISIDVNKISSGKVKFTFKMTKDYAIERGKLTLYADEENIDEIQIDTKNALTKDGFIGELKLSDASLFEIRLEDSVYNGNIVDLKISKKFAYQFMN
ncbi:MAG: hypothetical protein PUA90_02940 [bacterium]|nr:hypothetical protein [bacterium]